LASSWSMANAKVSVAAGFSVFSASTPAKHWIRCRHRRPLHLFRPGHRWCARPKSVKPTDTPVVGHCLMKTLFHVQPEDESPRPRDQPHEGQCIGGYWGSQALLGAFVALLPLWLCGFASLLFFAIVRSRVSGDIDRPARSSRQSTFFAWATPGPGIQ